VALTVGHYFVNRRTLPITCNGQTRANISKKITRYIAYEANHASHHLAVNKNSCQ